ncbi:hypothetical protein [Bradyrhizobium sp. AUGA SZCCT0283]|uniref:hypothetical protein n=1 Tax=Bradyrhizobium sp. AUGA SZCCT0283 TaxID=2807671 RepID=UPI001BABBE9B|nr:hypothetical protein [Bradyrhizobium sp. AUGA SZCCT0283]MBR1279259.1 hypothetical protein [Bradyrhizobium sp. AUGA SZCCT0283]
MTCTTLLAIFTLGSCNGLAGHDEMDRYFQRSDTITMSAGNAKEVNIAAQTIHPWPKGVNDRRIVVQAAKTNGAITRYRAGNQPRDPLPAFGISSVGQGHLPMGTAGATAAAVDAGGAVFQGTGAAALGAGVRP